MFKLDNRGYSYSTKRPFKAEVQNVFSKMLEIPYIMSRRLGTILLLFFSKFNLSIYICPHILHLAKKFYRISDSLASNSSVILTDWCRFPRTKCACPESTTNYERLDDRILEFHVLLPEDKDTTNEKEVFIKKNPLYKVEFLFVDFME